MREYIKTKRIIPHHVAEEIAEEVIQILKSKSLTIREAWYVIDIVREELHNKAFETKLEKEEDPEELPGKDFLQVIIKEPQEREGEGECVKT